MHPLGMQTSERPLDRLVRRQMPFGSFIIYLNRSGAGPGALSEAQRRTT
jgi:hypothetical protein